MTAVEYEAIVQTVLEEIDRRITETICAEDLARTAGYSLYHFCRIFMNLTGMPVKGYILRRKLEFALYDLMRGEKILDVAMCYGFETHVGFTKAFKKRFGCPPSLYRLHVMASPPTRATIESIKRGGTCMQVEIKEKAPFTLAGYPSRHCLPGVGGISDIPAFWDKRQMEVAEGLSALHEYYTKGPHFEAGVCFDLEDEQDCFTYMVGVGEADSETPQLPGVYHHVIPGGLYAVLTTPWAEEAVYTKTIQEAWKDLLENWLPHSPYEFNGTREAYEYYDERDHAWLHDGKCCMDICVPIQKRG